MKVTDLAAHRDEYPMSTFSIVAFDPETRDLGVAVQSKFLAVGAVVPWARAGVGAIATQAWANTSYGPEGLDLLSRGMGAAAALECLISGDGGRDHRQVGMVDAAGRTAAYTGNQCFQWAGHIIGPNFTCQGNILVGQETVQAMAQAFTSSSGSLAQRLVAALAAGQEAGGDSRGQQSAALLVVRERGGYGGRGDRYVDLRVDDHPEPIRELGRLLGLFGLYFYKTEAKDLVPLEGAAALEVKGILSRLGYFQGTVDSRFSEDAKQALRAFCLKENLEERLRDDDLIDGVVLRFMRERYGARSRKKR
ncbi:MAG: DUF1028 domain-containing protein [Chloroflexota bacterium]